MVRVLVLGTGVYPNIVTMSERVRGAAEVTKPFPFTANFKGVLTLNTLGFTVFKVMVTGLPVVPNPVTSPIKLKLAEGKATVTGVILVTNPLLFTVTTGMVMLSPYTPGAVFTVERVKGTAPGPLAVPSPYKEVIYAPAG